MLKKTITYDDFGDPPQEITEDFYFNFTKVEILEMHQLDHLTERIEALNKTEDKEEAYHIFKELILSAYGEKSEDNRKFFKTPEIRAGFEASPALSVMIEEFLLDPKQGALFIEKALPARLVAEVKADMAKEESLKDATVVAPEPEPPVELMTVDPEKTWDSYSRTELLEMPQAQFRTLIPRHVKDMSKEQLVVAMQRRSVE